MRPLLAPVAARDLRDSVELSRLDEFEADAVAARVVGGAALAGALLELAMDQLAELEQLAARWGDDPQQHIDLIAFEE